GVGAAAKDGGPGGKAADPHGIPARPRIRTPACLRPMTISPSSLSFRPTLLGKGEAFHSFSTGVTLQPAYRSAEIFDRIYAGGSSARCAIGPAGADSRVGGWQQR